MTDLYHIPASNLPRLRERIAGINKRAAKLSQPPVEVEIVDRAPAQFSVYCGPSAEGYSVTMMGLTIRLHGVNPMLEGWQVAGIVEPGDHSNFIGALPRSGLGDMPERFRTGDGRACEHCNLRRHRAKVVILHNPVTDEWRQVGTTCLADFTGHDSPEHALTMAELLTDLERELDDWCGGEGRAVKTISAETTLIAAVTMIRVFGWISKGQAANDVLATSTATRVSAWLSPGPNPPAWFQDVTDAGGTTEADVAKADEVMGWVLGNLAERSRLSDYEHNLVLAMQDEDVDAKRLGLICSAVSAYYRHLERSEEIRAQAKVSTWIGQPKQRLKGLTGKVTTCRHFESDYGTRTMLKMATAEGAIVVWWASKAIDVTPGTNLKMDATVKAHQNFQGVAETVVTRATLI